jgi:uncharacterized membrane protein (UPF0127 family)
VTFAAAVPLLAAAQSCSETSLELRQNGVKAQFNIEIARTPAEQAQGLMFREEMPQFNGMLFTYDRPHSVSFWMKNTLIPLDMLFIDETGVVKRVHRNAVPLDTTPIFGGDEVQYVLEINGGLANMLNLSEGAEMRYIGISQENAIWPCE